MSLTKLGIKIAIPIPHIEDFNNYLFIGPHPDDIEIGAGATIAKLAKKGKKITFLICTDGRYGDGFSNGIKGDELVLLRKKESLESAKILGVTDVRFLDLCDGAGYSSIDLIRAIAKIVGEVKPDIIFAPDPLSKSECHPDHLNVGNAAKTVACFAPYASLMAEQYDAQSANVSCIAYYMTSRPNRFVKTKGYKKLQEQAIFDCHLSQYPKNAPEASSLKLYLSLRSIQYGFTHFCSSAEGFRVYNATRMHCLPEAN